MYLCRSFLELLEAVKNRQKMKLRYAQNLDFWLQNAGKLCLSKNILTLIVGKFAILKDKYELFMAFFDCVGRKTTEWWQKKAFDLAQFSLSGV